jgi:hypothetical protein
MRPEHEARMEVHRLKMDLIQERVFAICWKLESDIEKLIENRSDDKDLPQVLYSISYLKSFVGGLK